MKNSVIIARWNQASVFNVQNRLAVIQVYCLVSTPIVALVALIKIIIMLFKNHLSAIDSFLEDPLLVQKTDGNGTKMIIHCMFIVLFEFLHSWNFDK